MKDVICIVPSKIDRIFRIFATAYRDTITCELIVIDGDGLSDEIKKEFSEFTYIDAPRPFAIYKAFNDAFKLTGQADVVTITDDVYIHTANIIEKLQQVAYADENIGMVVPLLQNAFTEDQWVQNQKTETDYVDWIPYIRMKEKACMDFAYIRRDLLAKVGVLDENYRWHRGDVDFSKRVLEAGYEHAICYATFAQHGGPIFGRPFENTIFDQDIDTGPDKAYWNARWEAKHYDIPRRYEWSRYSPAPVTFDPDESRKYYNETMPGFQEALETEPELELREELIAEIVKVHGGFAMDLGCGNGKLLTWLKLHDYISDGIGVDISDVMVDMAYKTASNNGVELKFIKAAIESLMFGVHRPIDVIIASETLEHVFNAHACLRKIVQYLSNKGVFVGSVPNEHYCASEDHLHQFSKDSLTNLLKGYFSDVSVVLFDYSQQENSHYANGAGPQHLIFTCENPMEI
ncbi:MAG: methyltransferase domain-containing protein [Candidatus Thorarchaeota archaeon]